MGIEINDVSSNEAHSTAKPRAQRRASACLPVDHAEERWHEAHQIFNWKVQARIIVLCQKMHWVVLPPTIFMHFLLKRDWGMAIGPFFAFAIYSDVRSLDLFLAASLGGVLCGAAKHFIRSPRPFWIVPEVFLKEGVEEMSWGTPSAHSAIQGGISAVLVYYDYENMTNWIVNGLILLFTMFSRLYLAVHWPQDVVLGALIGIASGYVVCASKLHLTLLNFAEENHPYGGILYLSIGATYNIVVYVVVKYLDRISDNNPVPEAAIKRYKIGVGRALRILNKKTDEPYGPDHNELEDQQQGDEGKDLLTSEITQVNNLFNSTMTADTSQKRDSLGELLRKRQAIVPLDIGQDILSDTNNTIGKGRVKNNSEQERSQRRQSFSDPLTSVIQATSIGKAPTLRRRTSIKIISVGDIMDPDEVLDTSLDDLPAPTAKTSQKRESLGEFPGKRQAIVPLDISQDVLSDANITIGKGQVKKTNNPNIRHDSCPNPVTIPDALLDPVNIPDALPTARRAKTTGSILPQHRPSTEFRISIIEEKAKHTGFDDPFDDLEAFNQKMTEEEEKEENFGAKKRQSLPHSFRLNEDFYKLNFGDQPITSLQSVQVKHRGSWIGAADILRQHDIECDSDDESYFSEGDMEMINKVSKAIEFANTASYFKDVETVDKIQDEHQKKILDQGIFLRTDVAFNPDSKERFWYNSINVMGCYTGLALYSCFVGTDEVEFRPILKWTAAMYAVGITFSSIVYTRTILRSMLSRTQFKIARMTVYFFLGFFTYGLFPLSYLTLENTIRKS